MPAPQEPDEQTQEFLPGVTYEHEMQDQDLYGDVDEPKVDRHQGWLKRFIFYLLAFLLGAVIPYIIHWIRMSKG